MSTDSSPRNLEQVSPSLASESQVDRLTAVIFRSQHNYRELIDNLDQALFTISLQGEVRVANLRFSEILGVSFQELIGHSLSEFVESPTFEEAKKSASTLLQKGSWTGTIPVRLKKDKEVRHFDCWLQSVVEDGQIVSITGWARDITIQHESEIRFAELFESLSEGILFVTPDGRLLGANPALVRMLGFDSEKELREHNFRDMYADPEARDALITELEEKGFVRDREIVLCRKDGKRIYCLTSGFAIRDASGRPIRLQGTIVDITERREMEKRLQQEQGFVRRLMENFPDVIAVLDCEGRFTYISDRVQSVLGRSPKEYIGEILGARASEEDRLSLQQMLDRVVHGGATRDQVEFRALHADGTWRVLLTTAGPLLDENGKISGMVTSARDITEAKQFEQQLAQKERFTAMGQMMAGAAHELNNPLTAILGVSDLLQEGATDEVARRQGNLILQQARRAAGIVQNLLAFSRPISHGQSKLQLDQIVKEALQLTQSALQQKSIAVTFIPPDDLPPVEGDRKLLLQVFMNIITNVEQSISPARDHGLLEVSLSRIGEKIRVTFADDGPGIPAEILGKIFDPFFTTKRPGGGSGLGLTICLAVVKEHGGTIEVESTLGVGAKVHVLLPVAEALVPLSKVDGAAPAAGSSSVPSSLEALRGHTVLIVDDEESIREILQEGLLARGMRVHSAGSSEAALSYLETNTCEIIVCDFNLPGMSGDQFFEKLTVRSGGSLPRFVFMTGELVDPAVVARYREKNAWVLQKPFHIPTLAGLLAEILQPQTATVK